MSSAVRFDALVRHRFHDETKSFKSADSWEENLEHTMQRLSERIRLGNTPVQMSSQRMLRAGLLYGGAAWWSCISNMKSVRLWFSRETGASDALLFRLTTTWEKGTCLSYRVVFTSVYICNHHGNKERVGTVGRKGILSANCTQTENCRVYSSSLSSTGREKLLWESCRSSSGTTS